MALNFPFPSWPPLLFFLSIVCKCSLLLLLFSSSNVLFFSSFSAIWLSFCYFCYFIYLFILVYKMYDFFLNTIRLHSHPTPYLSNTDHSFSSSFSKKHVITESKVCLDSRIKGWQMNAGLCGNRQLVGSILLFTEGWSSPSLLPMSLPIVCSTKWFPQ